MEKLQQQVRDLKREVAENRQTIATLVQTLVMMGGSIAAALEIVDVNAAGGELEQRLSRNPQLRDHLGQGAATLALVASTGD